MSGFAKTQKVAKNAPDIMQEQELVDIAKSNNHQAN